MRQALERLPRGLPQGRLVVPDPRYAHGEPVTEPVLWVTDEPVPDAGPLWARLLSEHPGSGLWPLLLTGPRALDLAGIGGGPEGVTDSGSEPCRPWQTRELAPVSPGKVADLDAGTVLAGGWYLVTAEGADFGADAIPALPFPSWPGLAEPGTRGADPYQHAAGLATVPGGTGALTFPGDPPYLGLVPAADGAGAIATCGWLSPSGGTAGTSAVVRSWQDRFGARLCSLGIDTLVVSVAWPPSTREHARRIGAEHFAFCSDLTDMVPFDEYAEGLIGAGVWDFWWD